MVTSVTTRLNRTLVLQGHSFFFYETAGYCNCPTDDCTATRNNAAGGAGNLYRFVGDTSAVVRCVAQGCTGEVELFEHNLKGKVLRVGVGRYDSHVVSRSIGNDKASSIRVPPGCVAEVYEHEFTGRKSVFSAGTYDYAAYTKMSKNDDASSMIVKDAAAARTTRLAFGDIKLISNPCGTEETTAPSRFFTTPMAPRSAPSKTWQSWVQPLGGLASLQAPGKMRSVMDSCADGNLNCTFPNFNNCKFQAKIANLNRKRTQTDKIPTRTCLSLRSCPRAGAGTVQTKNDEAHRSSAASSQEDAMNTLASGKDQRWTTAAGTFSQLGNAKTKLGEWIVYDIAPNTTVGQIRVTNYVSEQH